MTKQKLRINARALRRFGLGFERRQHHLAVFAHLLLERRADQLGQRRHAEIVVDVERDGIVPPRSHKRPRALERVEIAFEQLVVDAQRGIVEAIFFEPLDRRVFDQRLPAREHAIGVTFDDRHRLDVGHELRKALLILGEFVDQRGGRVDHDRCVT